MEYFIIDNNGQQAGPFSQDQLVQKRITPETLVWTQGMQDWTPAWKIAELKTTLEASEALRANDANQQNQQQNVEQAQQQAQQQAYQQAQQQAYQEAYQQGFQHGAAMNQGNGFQGQGGFQGGNGYQPEQPHKKTNHTLWKIILGLIVFILLMLAVTNPGADAHKDKVRTEVGKAIEKATETTDNNFFSQAMRSVAKMMADNVMSEAMDQLFQYHNYIVCSKGTVEFNGKQHTVSFGILGKVYTMNADDMVKALENDAPAIDVSSSSSDDENADAADATDDNSDEGMGANVQKKLEEKANQALDKAAEKVSKKVEEKINQKLNEATDSSTVEKIIDKILELF